MNANELPEDGIARIDLDDPELLAAGFRPYERHRMVLHHDDGSSDELVRDIVRAGNVVGVIGYDPKRELLVLIRQFRLAAHLATGRGELVEIVAGGVERGESILSAARRECLEEIGVAPSRLLPILRFLPTPGVTDECAHLFLGIVDATKLPERAGASNEVEVTHPFALPVDVALAAMAQGRFANAFLIMSLQWLALNRAHLPTLLGKSVAV